MAIWEYKVISSGKGGFATPALLENFVNQLGKEEWEIISFQTAPDNPLAFHGLARRGMQREWNLEAAAAAKAQEEAKQRLADERAAREAEIAELRRRESGAPTPVSREGEAIKPPAGDEPVRDETFRRVRDTDLDHDPDALAAEAAGEVVGDWDEFPEEEELPTLFDAIKPHLRRNQRSPGQAVAIDYLAKRWNQLDEDIVGALEECGFVMPPDEDSPPDYFEYDGDLYWMNRTNRGQLFINVREKPRPKFKPGTARKLDPSDPEAAEVAAEHDAERDREAERKARVAAQEAERKARQEAMEAERQAKREAARIAREAKLAEGAEAAVASDVAEVAPTAVSPVGALPAGEALIEFLRPRMRRNRRGPGVSGSTAFLAKAMRQPEEDLVAALAAVGLVVPASPGARSDAVEIGGQVFWLNQDGRGGIWINGRDKRDLGPDERPANEAEGPAETPPEAAPSEVTVVTAVAETRASVESSAPAEAAIPAGPDAPAEAAVDEPAAAAAPETGTLAYVEAASETPQLDETPGTVSASAPTETPFESDAGTAESDLPKKPARKSAGRTRSRAKKPVKTDGEADSSTFSDANPADGTADSAVDSSDES